MISEMAFVNKNINNTQIYRAHSLSSNSFMSSLIAVFN